jgi:hypothetical protein
MALCDLLALEVAFIAEPNCVFSFNVADDSVLAVPINYVSKLKGWLPCIWFAVGFRHLGSPFNSKSTRFFEGCYRLRAGWGKNAHGKSIAYAWRRNGAD